MKISDKELRESARLAAKRIGQHVQTMSVEATVLHALAAELLRLRASDRVKTKALKDADMELSMIRLGIEARLAAGCDSMPKDVAKEWSASALTAINSITKALKPAPKRGRSGK